MCCDAEFKHVTPENLLSTLLSQNYNVNQFLQNTVSTTTVNVIVRVYLIQMGI